MQTKPNISPERLAQLRAESQQLRPMLAAEMPAVRDESMQWVNSLTKVVARHSKEIDEFATFVGCMRVTHRSSRFHLVCHNVASMTLDFSNVHSTV